MALFRDISNTPRETSAARSWVMFNGTSTVGIYVSFNISSITDAGTGSYRVNLTNGHPNNQYCCLATGTGANSSGGTATMDSTSFGGTGSNYPNSSTSYQIRTVNGGGGTQDMQWVNSATWRED